MSTLACGLALGSRQRGQKKRRTRPDPRQTMFRALGFFTRRWRGETPLPLVLWRDMLGIGSVINLLVSFLALLAASQGLGIRLAAALHFLPLPYNLFLFLVVWRSPQRSLFTSCVAVAYLVVMTIV